MIETLIVEDDPRLAEAHVLYTDRVPGFHAAGSVHSGREAMEFLRRERVDLVLLDFYLPDMGGLEVCRALRAAGLDVDVIAVTSAADTQTVRAAVAHGVVQYLIKPFTFASFRDKLERYAEYRDRLAPTGGETAQHEVDRAFSALRTSTGGPLPKGFSPDTLAIVVGALESASGPRSASEIAAAAGMARVTARRYLELLADRGTVERQPRYGGTGRPEHGYRLRG
ncbi:response regulator [Glycomyces buryatensis]|uniref:Transcriptional regulatory protein n=1 Tax=Glycomyces buryatensis TaxID=2570927 RepID=A0A4S8QII8_9ACTN|nr:response regulator [Glycomyces buryatensis]THV43571.1 response regulator [Glycomyces buryatensis]